MLLEDNPLRSKPVKKKRKGKNKESEQQFLEMEQKFEAYSSLSSYFLTYPFSAKSHYSQRLVNQQKKKKERKSKANSSESMKEHSKINELPKIKLSEKPKMEEDGRPSLESSVVDGGKEMNFFPDEKDIKTKDIKEINPAKPSMDVIEEEDKIKDHS